jgi:hypothetical protein
LIPESHRSFKVVGCRGGFGESFQLFGILTWRPVGALVVLSSLEPGSTPKGEIAHKHSDDDGEHDKHVGPPRAERVGKTVSDFLKNVVVQPTKEPAQHEFEAVSDPREESAQGMWKVARRRLEG